MHPAALCLVASLAFLIVATAAAAQDDPVPLLGEAATADDAAPSAAPAAAATTDDVAPVAEPADPAAASATPDASPWRVVCADDSEAADDAAAVEEEERAGVCVMTQRLLASPDGPRVLQVYLRRLLPAERPDTQDAPEKTDRLRIDLPFGLDFEAGIELRIDGEAWMKVPVRTCVAAGCIAWALLDADAVTRLKRGGRLGVVVKALNGRVIAWPVSLIGFTAAHAELEAAGR